MESGTITKMVQERGFAFISQGDEKDIFFHTSNSPEFDNLREGMQVEFELFMDEKSGRDQGKNVREIKEKD